MTKTQTAPQGGFTTSERAYIRGELDMVFSTLPTVAEGFMLKTWRGGLHAGKHRGAWIGEIYAMTPIPFDVQAPAYG